MVITDEKNATCRSSLYSPNSISRSRDETLFGKILLLIDEKFLGILQEKEKGCQPASVIRIAAGSPTMGNY